MMYMTNMFTSLTLELLILIQFQYLLFGLYIKIITSHRVWRSSHTMQYILQCNFTHLLCD